MYILTPGDRGKNKANNEADSFHIPEVNRVKKGVSFNLFQVLSYLLGK